MEVPLGVLLAHRNTLLIEKWCFDIKLKIALHVKSSTTEWTFGW